MRDGKLIGTRTSTELERRELVRMMIGRDLREQRIGPTEVNEGKVVLKVEPDQGTKMQSYLIRVARR